MSEQQLDIEGGVSTEVTPAAAPSTETWHSGFEDESLRGIPEIKGWNNPEDAVKSYHNLEKLLGADKAGRTVVMPSDFEDADQVNEFYGKLGRPESAELYSYEAEEGSIGEAFKEVAHKAGYTDEQAKIGVEFYQAQEAAIAEAKEAELVARSDAEYAEIEKEWGMAADQNFQLGKSAIAAFPELGEYSAAIEDAIGTKNMLNLYKAIGEGLGEAPVHTGGSADGAFGVMSPAGAQAAIAELQSNPAHMEARLDPDHVGHKAAAAKETKLFAMAYPKS